MSRPRYGRAARMATVRVMKQFSREQGKAIDQEEAERPQERTFPGVCTLCGGTHSWPDVRSHCPRCGRLECDKTPCQCEGGRE